jgi:hypothetical protein
VAPRTSSAAKRGLVQEPFHGLASVDLAAVRDTRDHDKSSLIINRVRNAIVSDSNP